MLFSPTGQKVLLKQVENKVEEKELGGIIIPQRNNLNEIKIYEVIKYGIGKIDDKGVKVPEEFDFKIGDKVIIDISQRKKTIELKDNKIVYMMVEPEVILAVIEQ